METRRRSLPHGLTVSGLQFRPESRFGKQVVVDKVLIYHTLGLDAAQDRHYHRRSGRTAREPLARTRKMSLPGTAKSMRQQTVLLEPLHQILSGESIDGFQTWDLSGAAPQFEIRGVQYPLSPGLYRLKVTVADASQAFEEPMLFADSGNGYSEQATCWLNFTGHGSVREAVFLLRRPAMRLRFDPRISPGTLRLGEVGLEKASRALWWVRGLAKRLRRRIRSFGDVASQVTRAGATFGRGGMGAFLDALDRIAEAEGTVNRRFQELDLAEFRERLDTFTAFARTHLVQGEAAIDGRVAGVSVIVPVYQPDLSRFRELLASLLAEVVQPAEIIFVLDGPQPGPRRLIAAFKPQASKVVLVELDRNHGVGSACNAGLAAATQPYVMILDHDDIVLPPLFEFFAHAAAADPDIVYLDEAIVDEDARNVLSVTARGAFDLPHYLSHPYVVHPVFVRRDLALRAGGFDASMRISHDVDFFLRCVLHARTITHVPLVGYLWRQVRRSLGSTRQAEFSEASRLAIQRFVVARFGWPETSVAKGTSFNMYDIKPPPRPDARVAIIIPTKNRGDLLDVCVQSIVDRRGFNQSPIEIFIVDHESDDPSSLKVLERWAAADGVTVLAHKGPWNFSEINNAAVRQIEARGEFSHFVFMNNDVELKTNDWLDGLLGAFRLDDVGIVGCYLSYPDTLVQHAGVIVGLCGAAEHAFKFSAGRLADGRRAPGYLGALVATRHFGAVTAALMVVARDVFDALGGFDEAFAVGFNDTDLCLRANDSGWRTCYVGRVEAVHYESASRGKSVVDPHPMDTARFIDRHLRAIRRGDDYYGLTMNWSSPALEFSLEPRKPFRLRTISTAAGKGQPS